MRSAQAQRSSTMLRGEFRLYAPLANHFSSKGYAVKKASHYGDILAYDERANTLVSVEAKPHDAREAIGQAYSATDFADFVYAAIPADGKPHTQHLERLGIGLLLVTRESAEVAERLSPRKNVPFDPVLRKKVLKSCFGLPRREIQRKGFRAITTSTVFERTVLRHLCDYVKTDEFTAREGVVLAGILRSLAAGCPFEHEGVGNRFVGRRTMRKELRTLAKRHGHSVDYVWSELDFLAECGLAASDWIFRVGTSKRPGFCFEPRLLTLFGGVSELFQALREKTGIRFDLPEGSQPEPAKRVRVCSWSLRDPVMS